LTKICKIFKNNKKKTKTYFLKVKICLEAKKFIQLTHFTNMVENNSKKYTFFMKI